MSKITVPCYLDYTLVLKPLTRMCVCACVFLCVTCVRVCVRVCVCSRKGRQSGTSVDFTPGNWAYISHRAYARLFKAQSG